MFMFQTLKFLPAHILGIEGEVVGILGFGLAAVLLLLVPVIDRPSPEGRRSRVFTWITLGIIGYMIALTALGYVLSPSA
jgi:quinol-cytochrome oxidoreductase complex cytochrome b subunit